MSAPGTAALSSKYAWRQLARQGLPKRPAAERVSDFLEIYGLLDEASAREQASRCIQCPNPGCVGGCPLCNPIPEWLLLTAEGRFLQAAAVLGSASTLAEVCARLCPNERLCEADCVLSGAAEPVAIRAIEQFLAEYAAAHGRLDAGTAPPNGRRVAVLGSGPAGLACADELAKWGCAVTVFDTALVPGGLLVNGTPAFKLGPSIIERRVDILRKRGVVFRLGVAFGEDLSLERLRGDFAAVFLGLDARQARPLEIPNAALPGVIQAVPFLLRQTTAIPVEVPGLDVAGKRVVVLGGGDTAMDCLRTAVRYGAREALCVYRRSEPDLPCARAEYENALEEGARFLFGAAPVAVLANRQGRTAGLRLIRTQADPASAPPGARGPVRVQPGTEFDLEADWIVPALGFGPAPLPTAGGWEGLATNADGGLAVDANQMTNLPGVFAGGDLVRGPSLVLHTVRDARRAALAIEAFLKG